MSGLFRRLRRAAAAAVLALGAAAGRVFAAGSVTTVTKATTHAGIDWGHGVTTAVVLEWAAKIGICLAVIAVLCAVVVFAVLERKR